MSFERGNGKFNINEYYNYLSIIKRNRMKHLAYMVACFVILLNVQLVNAKGDVKIGTQVWTSKNLDVSNTSCLDSSTYSVHVVNQEKKAKTNIYMH